MSKEIQGFQFIGQVWKVETKKDGSGRVTFDFSADAIDAVQKIQALAVVKDCCFSIGVVALNKPVIDFDQEAPQPEEDSHDEYIPDETGEIPI